ncbi:winged helix DNA-binding domain-containing protein [Arthrobacter sp. JZ12]|uniref:winged helix DNA-binding domain-containing protein n=1 Tax=Arthrobacter sp. JZ12 TaxID=2654190 RepID=UPI002B47D720|nr:winged helix DNA-binding domain-containing protein [Arthrobacter sp. JZ12]
MTAREIARWRLQNQYLSAPHAASAMSVLDHLLAVQAENPRQSEWAVACRTANPAATEITGLLETGELVRTHVLRPTWHYVKADDVGWLLDLTAPRVLPTLFRQLTDQIGWSVASMDRAVAVVVEALSDRAHRDRDDLAGAFNERGMSVDRHALMLLLAYAELNQLICSGQPVNGKHTYALFADRVPAVRRLHRDEALGQLALRYFTGHGPATEQDLAYWATLPLGDVRKGIESAREQLEAFVHDGRTYWHSRGSAPFGSREPAAHLLQILDEMYRGYQESRMVIDADGLVPGGREAGIGMALVDGQMIGRVNRMLNSRVRFELTSYRELTQAERSALEEAAARYGRFLGLEHDLLIRS